MNARAGIVACALVLSGCSNTSLCGNEGVDGARMLLLASDVEFSRISRSDGFAAATPVFVAEDAVLLPMNHPAVYGRGDIAGFFDGTEQMLFAWTPADGEVGASCDVGITFGAWSVQAEGGLVTGKYLATWRFDGTAWQVVTLMHNADLPSGTPEDDEGRHIEDGAGGEEPDQPDSQTAAAEPD